MSGETTNVAIACQGGGSHTAFTAGVLSTVLESFPGDHELVALSGTSGGAVCAALAWVGVQSPDTDPRSLLTAVWDDLSARAPAQQAVNAGLRTEISLRRMGIPFPEVSPAFAPPSWWAEDFLRDVLKSHVPFDSIDALIDEDAPALLISAVDVCSGRFQIFREGDLCPEAILASAAIPTLFRAIEVDGCHYWDGLFSKNPPLKDFVTEDDIPNPDEIWLCKINPQERDRVPITPEGIADRRNELGGNLSMNAEITFIETVNRWIERGYLPERFTHTEIRRLRLPRRRNLDWRTKLERDPEFIARLFVDGERVAADFLDGR